MKIQTIFFIILGLVVKSAGNPMTLNRLSSPIILDGRIDEPAWHSIEPVPLIMLQPTHNGAPTEKSEIRLAYDEEFLYAAGCFYDSAPASIRVNSLYRDRTNNDDTFDLIIDTFNDNENALWFCTNPAGVRIDIALSADGQSSNWDWNTFWEARTVQNEQGWFVEMRIPFSGLGFRKQSETVTIGIITGRFISRKNERLVFPAIPIEKGFGTPSEAQKFVLEGIQSQKPVYFTPYILGGFEENAKLNASANTYALEDKFEHDIGLDVKYNITGNLTIDATINTDFAQVEADEQQVNLTRFSLFFPEKRRFFQERAGLFWFATTTEANTRLFHSRQIGIHDGQAVPIIGGARLIGKAGKWDIGFMNIQTQEFEELPSENFGVMRLRRKVLNDYSFLGGMVTNRYGTDGSYNAAYGLDADFRLYKNEYLTVRWAQTFDDELIRDDAFRFLESASFTGFWQRRSQEGLNYQASISRVGADFRPEMGFTTRLNFTEYAWEVNYDKQLGEASRFRQISPFQLSGFAAVRNADHSLESAQLEYDTDLFWKTGGSIWLDAELYYEDLKSILYFPENTIVPAGSFTFFKCEGGYNMAGGRLLRTYISGGYGGFYDGKRYELGSTTIWNVSRYLELDLRYRFNGVRFSNRNQQFNSHIVQLRIRGAVNQKFSINGFLQYNHVDDILVSSVRLRHNFNEGHDLWLVYNEGMNTDRERVEPILLRTNNRTVLLKYTYTYRL